MELTPLKFIDKIGLELEGAWFSKQANLHDDRSVTGYTNKFLKWGKKYNNGDFPDYDGNYLNYIGEMVSPPLTYAQSIAYLEKNWPDDTMERCGFHIHVSFKNISLYSKLMEPDFFAYFLKAIEKWAVKTDCQNQWFWNRLRGENQFCKKIFTPEVQVKFKTKPDCSATRYSILNYCYGIHKTIECRLLPTFPNKDVAISAFQAVIEIFETYLTEHPPLSAASLSGGVEVDMSPTVSEEICVIDNTPVPETIEKSIAKPKVKDIIKTKKIKSLGLKPYNLFTIKNKAILNSPSSVAYKTVQSCSFFDIISGIKKSKELDTPLNMLTNMGGGPWSVS